MARYLRRSRPSVSPGRPARCVTLRDPDCSARAGLLGAGTSNLLRLALGSGMRVTSIGLVLGLTGSLAVTRVVASLLYGVGARDPLTMAAVAAVLAAVEAAACFVPALRAARADPMKALRFE